MKRIKVSVTAEHIAKGLPGHQDYCPIALAVRDATFSDDVSVFRHRVFFFKSATDYSRTAAKLPVRAARFMVRFDRMLGRTRNEALLSQFRPFKFWLEVL